MDATEKRAAAVKKLLTHARERLGLDVGFVLWDGSTAPAKLPGELFVIVIADEGVIAGPAAQAETRDIARPVGERPRRHPQRNDL